MWDVDSPLFTPKQRTALLGDFDDLSRQNRRDLRDRIIDVLIETSLLRQMPAEERKKLFDKGFEGEMWSAPYKYKKKAKWEERMAGPFEDTRWEEMSTEAQQFLVQFGLGNHPIMGELNSKERAFAFEHLDRTGKLFPSYLTGTLSFLFAGLLDAGLDPKNIGNMVEIALTNAVKDCTKSPDMKLLRPIFETDVSVDMRLADSQPPLIGKDLTDEQLTVNDLIEDIRFRYRASNHKFGALIESRDRLSSIFDVKLSLLETLAIIDNKDPSWVSENFEFVKDALEQGLGKDDNEADEWGVIVPILLGEHQGLRFTEDTDTS